MLATWAGEFAKIAFVNCSALIRIFRKDFNPNDMNFTDGGGGRKLNTIMKSDCRCTRNCRFWALDINFFLSSTWLEKLGMKCFSNNSNTLNTNPVSCRLYFNPWPLSHRTHAHNSANMFFEQNLLLFIFSVSAIISENNNFSSIFKAFETNPNLKKSSFKNHTYSSIRMFWWKKLFVFLLGSTTAVI